jgi:hypothetical protein
MSNLFAYLSYRDLDAAITWLEALGFERTTRQRDEEIVPVHAERRPGDAVVMVAPADEPYPTPELIGHSTGHGLHFLPQQRRTPNACLPCSNKRNSTTAGFP